MQKKFMPIQLFYKPSGAMEARNTRALFGKLTIEDFPKRLAR